MALTDIQGQPHAVETLTAALRGGNIHHAYLFTGPEGVGKELCARALAQALLCPKAPLGCGTCSSCTRVARLTHPDVMFLMPDHARVQRGLAGKSDFTGTPSREIRVEQVRGLQERLSLRALEGKRKVAVVSPADAMNESAQNAFLKTLEEPPRETVLVLVASAPDVLLPTVRSRCARVQFGPLPHPVLVERLKRELELEPDLAELVAALSGGSLKRALAYDVKALARRKEVIERFEALGESGPSALVAFAADFGATRDDAEEAFGVLTVWLRDVAVTQCGGAPVNRDLASLAAAAAGRTAASKLHRGQALIDAALFAMDDRNAAPRLQMEQVLIELQS